MSYIVLVALLAAIRCFGQSDHVSEKGFYIPKNIIESNNELGKVFTGKAKEKLRQIDENRLGDVSGPFILGEWFDHDSTRFANYFRQFRITDWQERDFLILLSFHRQLNHRAFDIQDEAKKLNDKADSLKTLAEAQYKINVIADSIYGVFIPQDLKSSFRELDRILDDTTKLEIKNKKSVTDMAEYHMGLGRWMRNNWGLWNGSRLRAYLRERGIEHPDNMSGVILTGYWHYLNGKMEDEATFLEAIKRQEQEFKELVENSPDVLPPKLKNTKKFYTKEYKRFLRRRKIDDFDVYIP